jgi:primosomal protein N''
LSWLQQQQAQDQQQQQLQEQHGPHLLAGGQLPFAPQMQPYGEQQQQALPHTRQSVSRHSAPRFGLVAERRRTSVSRSSLPATSSTLRRRTPDPQLISSW